MSAAIRPQHGRRHTDRHPHEHRGPPRLDDGLHGPAAARDRSDRPGLDAVDALALLFDLTRALLSPEQRSRAVSIMQRNLAHHNDWIVLNNSMKVLGSWAEDDVDLRKWLEPHARRLADDPRRAVALTARRLLQRLDS